MVIKKPSVAAAGLPYASEVLRVVQEDGLSIGGVIVLSKSAKGRDVARGIAAMCMIVDSLRELAAKSGTGLLRTRLQLEVSEASVSRNRSTIIVPAGSARDEGWVAFRNILAEINEASRLFVLPNQMRMVALSVLLFLICTFVKAQQNSEPSERLAGLSDDVGAGFISSHSTQSAPTSDLNVDRAIDLPPSDETGNLSVSKVIRADQKRFFFDLGSNNRGHFLRISEVAGSDRSSIILPLSGLRQFYEMVGHFVDITKDRIEGMTGANINMPLRRTWGMAGFVTDGLG
ncbi:hypothetical protein RJ639_019859 [Escallonia herrerae]|uniref:Uncharacterized protein n=1 Tax=Escallonia herrerae TaxID=1293975 RepID=A0AA88V7B5_9ASTE|nr:hypothetical protein RJ639_019859 [Escallonia herrerae]